MVDSEGPRVVKPVKGVSEHAAVLARWAELTVSGRDLYGIRTGEHMCG